MSATAIMPHAISADRSHIHSNDPESWRPNAVSRDIPATNGECAQPAQPSRLEKGSRRESRLGLRNMFTRSKSLKHSDGPGSPNPTQPLFAQDQATQGIPYHSHPPGKPLAGSESTNTLATTVEEKPRHLLEPERTLTDTTKQKQKRGSAKAKFARTQHDAPWDSSPFHKVLPTAMRHATLAAASVPADLIVKAHDKKASESLTAPGAAIFHTDDSAKPKRRHRGNRSDAGVDLEWTSKIYVLTGSGYLLEYSSEGSFDRLPEKALRLSQNSAAFASDMIPGRHWVLQVASTVRPNGSALVDPRPFFKLPFRAPVEKRSAKNMLMVFDKAEDMDEWLASLRRSIQALGGKKSLSETGKSLAENTGSLHHQASQSTLTLKDPSCYPESTGASQAWPQHLGRRESQTSFAMSDNHGDVSTDDLSTTNSIASQEGRQLDSLRTSAHRLSCASVGQKTVMTSTGSSPATSPMTDAFPSFLEEQPQKPHADIGAEATLRPNASAIVDRRRSLQTMSPFVEVRQPPTTQRPQSTLISAQPAGGIGGGATTPNGVSPPPNFSVPISSSRRFSSLKMPTLEASPPTSSSKQVEAPLRAPPPVPLSLLRISRPLSMVMDQPSPRESIPERPATRHAETHRLYDSELDPLPTFGQTTFPQQSSDGSAANPPTHSTAGADKVYHSPRRLSSMGALRQRNNSAESGAPRAPPDSIKMRSNFSAQLHGHLEKCWTPGSSRPERLAKRASMMPYVNDQTRSMSKTHSQSPAPPPSVPLPPVPDRSGGGRPRASSATPSLLNHRSMPQLAEGPPPAPPPTCALPPIPMTKMSERT